MIRFYFVGKCTWSWGSIIKINKFPGGEMNIRLDLVDIQKYGFVKEIRIKAIIKSSDDIMALVMLTDALRRQYHLPIKLSMPYIPYARQDRVCNEGEALSIKVFADLINFQNYAEVEVVDPHSDVASALLNRCKVIPQHELIKRYMSDKRPINDPGYPALLVCPDAGARKKMNKISSDFHELSVVHADKVRWAKTGEITETQLWKPDFNFNKRPSLIIDDICDGGRTFIELAKLIRKRNGGKIYLWVTHGIFSKGMGVFDELIDHVYTTDSYCEIESNDKLTVFKL